MPRESQTTQNNLVFLDNPGARIGVPDLDPAFLVGRAIKVPVFERRGGGLLLPVGVPNLGGGKKLLAPEINLVGGDIVRMCFGVPFAVTQLDGSGPSQATDGLSLSLVEDSRWRVRIHTNSGFSEKDRRYFSTFMGIFAWNALKKFK